MPINFGLPVIQTGMYTIRGTSLDSGYISIIKRILCKKAKFLLIMKKNIFSQKIRNKFFMSLTDEFEFLNLDVFGLFLNFKILLKYM